MVLNYLCHSFDAMKTVANFSPGPSQIYLTVEDHVRSAFREGIPSISHRSKQFEGLVAELKAGLKELMQLPDEYSIYFTASATETWERVIQNLVAQRSHHYVNGAFSSRFAEISRQLGKVVTETRVPLGQGFAGSPATETAELIALTHNETSTGVMMPVDWMQQVRQANPGALLSVDAVSSLPYPALPYAAFDNVFFSVQKGIGLPAGLGVWMVNDRCHERAEQLLKEGHAIGTYHNLPTYRQNGVKNQTPETPNVLGIYLLGKVVKDFLARGIKTLRQETDYKAAVLYQALDQHPLISSFVQESGWRSKTVIVAETGEHTRKLAVYLAETGLIAGDGYGELKKTQLRFANFPAHSREQVEMLADRLMAFAG